MKEVVIVSAVRTPIGSFGGAFKDVSAVALGEVVVKAALERIDLNPKCVDDVIFGNVLSAGLGQNVARQVALAAGLPVEVSAFTINKVCGSGLKAVHLGAQAIMTGDADVVVVGGTENMSQAPYIMKDYRWGVRMGNGAIVDTMMHDGLIDAFHGYPMGVTAENIVKRYGFTREQQDVFALNSQLRAEKAIRSGRFEAEIVPVVVKHRKGEPTVVVQDEYPRFGASIENYTKLKPAFEQGGTVTAGNASGINDGAAALVLMSKEKANALGIKPLARFVVGASSGVAPEVMGTGPIPSSQKALKRAGWTVRDLDLIEANEAFAAQSLSVIKDLAFDPTCVNVNGGAIALGHPIGASGARILVTLVHEMIKRNNSKGMATLCIGGGQGMTVLIERDL